MNADAIFIERTAPAFGGIVMRSQIVAWNDMHPPFDLDHVPHSILRSNLDAVFAPAPALIVRAFVAIVAGIFVVIAQARAFAKRAVRAAEIFALGLGWPQWDDDRHGQLLSLARPIFGLDGFPLLAFKLRRDQLLNFRYLLGRHFRPIDLVIFQVAHATSLLICETHFVASLQEPARSFRLLVLLLSTPVLDIGLAQFTVGRTLVERTM